MTKLTCFSLFILFSVTGFAQINPNQTADSIPKDKELGEVDVRIIDPKKKGKELIKMAIAKRKDYQVSLNNYAANTYYYTVISSLPFEPDSAHKRKVDDVYEWTGKAYVKAPENFKDEVFKVNNVLDRSELYRKMKPISTQAVFDLGTDPDDNIGIAGKLNPENYIEGIRDAHFSLYDNFIEYPKFTATPIVSPLGVSALLLYEYYFLGSFYNDQNQLFYRIKITPKLPNESLLQGELILQDQSWQISSYKLQISPTALSRHKYASITGEYALEGDRLRPVTKEFMYYKLGETDTLMCRTFLRQSQFVDEFEIEKTKEIKKYHADAITNDTTFWNANRTQKIDTLAERFLITRDSISELKKSEAYLRSEDSIYNKFTIFRLTLAGIQHRNSIKKYQIAINPIIGMINLFGIGGLRFVPGMTYQKEIKNGHVISVEGLLNYGKVNKDLKWEFSGKFIREQINNETYTLSILDNYETIRNTQNVASSIFGVNRIAAKRISLGYSREWLSGLYLQVNSRYSHQSTITGIKYSDLMQTIIDTFKLNSFSPIDPYKVFEISTTIAFKFNQKYRIENGRKIVEASKYPTPIFHYRKGIPSIFGSNANFDYVELKVNYDRTFQHFGNLRMKVMYGDFLRKVNLRNLEYRYFRQSDIGFFSDPLNTMQVLSGNISTAGNFFQFNAIHQFNGFFLNKIPLLNRLKLEETIGMASLLVPNQNVQQLEYIYGLERRFKIMGETLKVGLYGVQSVNQSGQLSPTYLKISFMYFDPYTQTFSW